MGTIIKGILGGFSGKVGTVVGASWKGVDYMRSLPKKSSKPATQAQKDVRFKFGIITEFLSAINALVRVGFQSYKNEMTPLNAAVSQNIKEAVGGVSPNFEIDFTKIVYSRGDLATPWLPSALPEPGAVLTFNWDAGADSPLSHDDDQATVVVYNPDKKQFVYLQNAALRSDLQYELQLPLDYSTDEVQCYMSFVSADGKAVSSSIYVGAATVM